ncbi:MAG: HAD family hydrolase [Lachnospiraceae bacterium]|nr:HAD family hydrolase [Lachnospiraceae bacterium]
MIKWLFFDLGSTLIDERECTEYRTQELLKQKNSPGRDVLEAHMKMYAAMNRLPYIDTAKEFGLETVKWPKHLERLYDKVPSILEKLRKKYQMGIIANQSLGTENRLIKFGIRHFFDVVIASAEAGIEKPDPAIFQMALRDACCNPEEAYMIGDRLDNDIAPAAQIGMHTIWVRQGAFAAGNIALIGHEPDVIVDDIENILEYL